MKNLSYLCKHQTKGHEKTRIHHQHLNVWERNYRDCGAKIRRFMEVTKQFLEKVFSTKRMERYFALYPDNEARAISHYECNMMLAESLYVSLSVLEVTLRNALCRRHRSTRFVVYAIVEDFVRLRTKSSTTNPSVGILRGLKRFMPRC